MENLLGWSGGDRRSEGAPMSKPVSPPYTACMAAELRNLTLNHRNGKYQERVDFCLSTLVLFKLIFEFASLNPEFYRLLQVLATEFKRRTID
jgi:hypothetical protein